MNNILKYDMDEDVSKSHTKKSDRKKKQTRSMLQTWSTTLDNGVTFFGIFLRAFPANIMLQFVVGIFVKD